MSQLAAQPSLCYRVRSSQSDLAGRNVAVPLLLYVPLPLPAATSSHDAAD
eukprot:CAMPEP_0119321758 /NCGR_PEP_ID=MMETSP1333-20130426/56352_1 /TAXON_ID=418940 /ORGANISM="Scyphosphaera apsteinii, Strain RCC1455" /LENGTH=49 /DNA_ID=CAMNT_0007328805 /DNA_START=64 /DNA_END=213 /DNA_ORIENTATION=-